MAQYQQIKTFRSKNRSVVDDKGCEAIYNLLSTPKETKKFLLLTSLLLSVQTNDIITFKIMKRVIDSKFTAEKARGMKDSEIEDLIAGTNFKNKKIQYIRNVANLAENGPLPETLKAVVGLKGVGQKIGILYMQVGFGICEGISVDTHCHR